MRPSLITIAALLLTGAVQAAEPPLAPGTLVYWGEPEGIERLETSRHKVDFFKLANQFESQSNKFFCGPTSAAMVLNALRVRRGSITPPRDESLLSAQDTQHLPSTDWSPLYQRYSQNNVLLLSPKPRETVLAKPFAGENGESRRDPGLQLQQLAQLLLAHQVDVAMHRVESRDDTEALKTLLVENLGHRNDYVIINYHRQSLAQPGGGHISPLAAYHQASDSFLIMDVTPNKADWVWVKSEALFAAMATPDTEGNRGFLLVREGSAR